MQSADKQNLKILPVMPGIKKSYADMTPEERAATVKCITGYDSMDAALNEKSRRQNNGKLVGLWDTLDQVMSGKKAWDPAMQVSDAVRDLIEKKQLELEHGIKKAPAIKPAETQKDNADVGNAFGGSAWGDKQKPTLESTVSDHPRVQYAMPIQRKDKEKEDNRIARRNELKKKIEELTGRPFVESLGIIQEINQINDTANMGLFGKPEIVDPRQDALNKLIGEAPAELFIPTEEEWAENLKHGEYAFAGGTGSGISLGLDELIDQGGEITPEQAKDLAKKGIDLLFVKYEGGKYYVPSKRELNEMMEKEHPISYLAGETLGELPVDILTGGLSKGGGAVAKTVIKAAPGVIKDITSAISEKKDVIPALVDILSNAYSNAGGGIVSDAVGEVLEKKLKESPELVKKLIETVSGKAVELGGQQQWAPVTGKKTDWNRALIDIIKSLAMGGKY